MATRIGVLALTWWTAGALVALVSSAAAQPVPTPSKPDVALGSRPETVIAEAVDSVQLIYGTVPKKFFKERPAYWGNGKESRP